MTDIWCRIALGHHGRAYVVAYSDQSFQFPGDDISRHVDMSFLRGKPPGLYHVRLAPARGSMSVASATCLCFFPPLSTDAPAASDPSRSIVDDTTAIGQRLASMKRDGQIR